MKLPTIPSFGSSTIDYKKKSRDIIKESQQIKQLNQLNHRAGKTADTF